MCVCVCVGCNVYVYLYVLICLLMLAGVTLPIDWAVQEARESSGLICVNIFSLILLCEFNTEHTGPSRTKARSSDVELWKQKRWETTTHGEKEGPPRRPERLTSLDCLSWGSAVDPVRQQGSVRSHVHGCVACGLSLSLCRHRFFHWRITVCKIPIATGSLWFTEWRIVASLKTAGRYHGFG